MRSAACTIKWSYETSWPHRTKAIKKKRLEMADSWSLLVLQTSRKRSST
jgi:hypothetical protein